jgi:hypothetical protein
MYEILMMILKKSAEPVEGNKGDLMLEFQSAESVDKQPAPRIVNCHYPCRYVCICSANSLIALFEQQISVS